MVGGQDIIIERPVDVRGKRRILEVLRHTWPEAIVEDARTDSAPVPLQRIAEDHLPDEFLVYREETSRKSWAEHGATGENADQMIHILLGATTVTCVVDGSETAGIAQQLRTALREISTPMIADSFFEGLEEAQDGIETEREVA